MRVIVPGDRVVVTDRMVPRDRTHSQMAYAGTDHQGILGHNWSAAVGYFIGVDIDVIDAPSIEEIDLMLWKGGWPDASNRSR